MDLIDPDTVKAVSDLGGWGVALVVLIGVVVSIMKGWLIPGHIYDREVRRADALDATLDTTTHTLQDLTKHVDAVTGTIEPPRTRRGSVR